GGGELQVGHEFVRPLPPEDVDWRPPAVRAPLRLAACDRLVRPARFFQPALLAPEASPDFRGGAQVDLVPLVVGIGAAVDVLQLGAEELLLAEVEAPRRP